MGRLDTIYRAFADYRKNTLEDRACAKVRRVLARADADGDTVEVVRVICHIEEDWIEAIEQGLEHIGKAIEEERQFIRSNGEVVPIEKVKNVSRESVEHLARHSNLITKEQKGEDIIPDQLYTVERLSDYAVYENRFLYMLLCYLRDFITFRYDKIMELVTTYNGSLRMRKTADADGRRTAVEFKLDERLLNDPFLTENNPEKEKIGRISDMLKGVLLYLSTPLMEFVSKSPKLKPPVTETNVLKMNKHFRGAMQLYYYITAYDKDGYTAERVVKTLNPFSDEVADEFAESISLVSFLTYEHGMGLEEVLKERYRAEEARRRELEEQRHLELLEKLRKRIRDEGCSPEEYMLLLEQRNRALEQDSAQLRLARAEIERLSAETKRQAEEIAALTEKLAASERAFAEQAAAHARELAELRESHAREIAELTAAHEREIEALHEEYGQKIAAINEAHEQAVAALNEEHARAVEELNAAHESAVQALNARREEELAQMQAEYERRLSVQQEEAAARSAAYEERLTRAAAENEAGRRALAESSAQAAQLRDEAALSMAKYNAMRKEHGLFTAEDDFTTPETFGEIEHQYEVFRAFFKQEWRKTKKRIRKEVFSSLSNVAVPSAPAEQAAQGTETPSPEQAAQGTETLPPEQTAVQQADAPPAAQPTEQGTEQAAPAAGQEAWHAAQAAQPPYADGQGAETGAAQEPPQSREKDGRTE